MTVVDRAAINCTPTNGSWTNVVEWRVCRLVAIRTSGAR